MGEKIAETVPPRMGRHYLFLGDMAMNGDKGIKHRGFKTGTAALPRKTIHNHPLTAVHRHISQK